MANPARIACSPLAVAFAFMAGALVAEARIGDSPEQMAGRMLQPDLGKYFTWPKDMSERDRQQALRDHPATPFAHLLPPKSGDWREDIFWKSALRRQLSNTDGWRVHVYYLKGQSVLECYRRVGTSLSEPEVNAILSRLRGGSTWRKVDAKPGPGTVIGYGFELGEPGNGVLRARQQGDWLIIFHRRFDDYLLERKKLWDADEEKRRSEERAEQEERAPVSVEGF